jgi:glycerol-3-phosphate dehydrogenase (NAD(P)+)
MPDSDIRMGIVGGGSWGTALAIHCASVGIPVSLWVYEEDLADRMAETRENDVYLPGAILPDTVTVTHRFEDCLTGTSMVMSVVPSHLSREVWSEAHSYLPVDATLINATKGIEDETYLTSSGVLAESIGGNIQERMVTLSGPTFAREVAQGLPAAAVIAGHNTELANTVQLTLNSENFRFYTNQDPPRSRTSWPLLSVSAMACNSATTPGRL